MGSSIASSRLLLGALVCAACTGCLGSGSTVETTTGDGSAATASGSSGGDDSSTASSTGGDGASATSGSTGGSASSSASSGSTGSVGRLKVAEWNIEFFGRADAGPSNDSLQTTNVTEGIRQVAPDIMAFEEVCDTGDFAAVLDALQSQDGLNFDSVVANDGSLGNPSPGYGGSWGQKTALIWRREIATRVAGQLVHRGDIDGAWGNTFVTRDPLEVELQLADGQLLYVIVVHLKAGADAASYQQRERESADLKAYVDAAHPGDAVMILGDWNDDLDRSIVSGDSSPFTNFLDDTANYAFATQVFSDQHASTTADHSGHPIDHHLVRQQLFGALVAGSAQIFQPTITSYGSTTSDHYPTVVEYQFP